MGWGDIFTIVNKWLPSKEEYWRNKKSELERKRDAFLNKDSLTASESAELGRVLVQLHQVQQKLENR